MALDGSRGSYQNSGLNDEWQGSASSAITEKGRKLGDERLDKFQKEDINRFFKEKGQQLE